MELSDIDLNQLVILQQLMLERRVSKVAEKLGLTQPAVAHQGAPLAGASVAAGHRLRPLR